MKKLLFGILTFTAIVSCNLFGKHTASMADSAKTDSGAKPFTTVNMSLNGIPQTTAQTLITAFMPSGDANPNQTQFWFDKKVLDSIFALFHTDSMGAKKPDGIRFYFYTMPVTVTTPLHSNIGLIIVSTYATTKVDGGVTKNIHADYYDHQATGLFGLGALLNGEFNHYTDDKQGALLFDVCNCDTPFTVEDPHDIEPSTAEKMVSEFPGSAFISKSEWFNVAMFSHFKKRIDKDGGDGIRIYVGRGADADDPLKVKKAKLLFVETMTVPKIMPVTHQDYFGNKTVPLNTINKSDTTGVPLTPPPPNVGETGESCPSHCD
jgi:hypothetical protein